MSRIGNKIIELDDSVTVNVQGNNVTVKGKHGELQLEIDPCVSIDQKDNTLTVVLKDPKQAAKHGLYRALIANMIEGVNNTYVKELELMGVGYKVQLKGKDLEFNLGYSHPVLYKAVDGITFEVESPTKFKVKGIDKQKVGQACAKIRTLRKRDAYKGKGIHFVGEIIKKKPGKSVKK